MKTTSFEMVFIIREVYMRIGFLTHINVRDFVTSLESDYDCDFIFNVGLMETGVVQAIDMERNVGVDAIISNTVTREVIKDHVNIPVIPLHIRNHNIVNAFYEAARHSKKIAFVDLAARNRFYNLSDACKLFDAKIQHYSLSSVSDAPNLLREILSDGFDTVVTTAKCMGRLAGKAGLTTVFVMPTQLDIKESIENAINELTGKQKEAIAAQWIRHAMDDTVFGCVGINNLTNRIEVINKPAQEYLGLLPHDLVECGSLIFPLCNRSALLDSIYKMEPGTQVIHEKTTSFLIQKEAVYDNQSFLGYFIKIAEATTIGEFDLSLRKQKAASAFSAKKTFNDIQGNSDAIKTAISTARKAAKTDFNILIEGESGVGKELFVQSIHNYSRRNNNPFVAINCSAIPPSLLESELFGYEQGAFTGATKGGKPGLFELAHTGTLFLDEIGDMPLELQAKLLRVLQEREVRRIGGKKIIPVDVRVIAATNKNMAQEITQKTFRSDLYYRLNVINIKIPPLRERKADIPTIARSFAATLSQINQVDFVVPNEKMHLLMQYDWPGNVRELQNFITKLFVQSEDDLSLSFMEEVLGELRTNNNCRLPNDNSDEISVPIGTLKEMENAIIAQLYHRFGKDKKRLEYTLHISGATLWRRIKECTEAGTII